MTDNNIASGFPYPTLTPVVPEGSHYPTYATLRRLQQEINANAMTIHSHRGGGLHGHLVLTVTPAVYLALPGSAAFAPPAFVQETRATTATARAAPAASSLNNHEVLKEAKQQFATYNAAQKVLRAQLLVAVPESLISSLRDATFAFSNVTCLAILTHLWGRYGKISPHELEANLAHMKSPWTPSDSINALFDRLEQGQALAKAGKDAISDAAAIRIGLAAIAPHAAFKDACKEWRRKPEEDQTMEHFHTHFIDADKEIRDNPLVYETTKQAGYHAANQVSSVAPIVANPKTNYSIATPKKATYCWTHGIMKNGGHNSATCKKKMENHQDAATVSNKMGGCTTEFIPYYKRQQPIE